MNPECCSDASLRRFSQLLDRDVSFDDMANRERFADFTESDVLEFRRLLRASGSIVTIQFMRCRIKGAAPLPEAVSFYQGVLLDGCSVDQWALAHRDIK